MKWIISVLMVGVLLNLQTLDTIYYGVYDNNMDQWVNYQEIVPETYEYNLEIPLTQGQVGYYFYNLGFGMVEYGGVTSQYLG